MWAKRLRFIPGLCVVLILVLHNTGIFELRLMDEIEQLSYDTRVRTTMSNTVDSRIVIVDIDQKSLLELGQWPWPRHQIKTLVDNLFGRYGIATLGFDVLFAEPDGQGGREQIERAVADIQDPKLQKALQQIAAGIGGDRALADSLTDRPVVLGYHFDASGDEIGLLPEPVFEDDGFMQHTIFAPKAKGYTAALPVLQQAATAGGFFSNPLIDEDGITRRLSLLVEYQGALFESLALAVARTYLDEIIEPEFGEAEIQEGIPILEALLLDMRVLPIDSRAAVQIPYRGRQGSFPYVSAVDVIHGTLDTPEILRDKIVLMGATAVGLFDLQSTPVQKDFAGVEVHANVIAGILDQSFKHLSPFSWAIELASIIVLGLLLTFLLPRSSPLWGGISVLAILLLIVAVNLYLWQSFNLLIPLAATLTAVIGVYVADVIYGFFVESKSKRQIRRAFSSFLSPALVQQLADDPSRLRLEGETREMTFLFTDIAGFTSFTEKNDPKILVQLLNEYLEGVCRIVMDHGGTIDKIVGDAVHAIYNAPLDQPDHAAQAVRSAIAIDEFSTAFLEEKKKQGIDFGITRIGVNTGPAVVGNFGGDSRFDYTAHGDAINTAARMESVNKHLGTKVCVSETTVKLCEGQDLNFRSIGSLVLKGKTVGIGAYEPISKQQSSSTWYAEYQQAFSAIEQKTAQALAMLEKLAKKYPEDSVIGLHLERLRSEESGVEIVLKEK